MHARRLPGMPIETVASGDLQQQHRFAVLPHRRPDAAEFGLAGLRRRAPRDPRIRPSAAPTGERVACDQRRCFPQRGSRHEMAGDADRLRGERGHTRVARLDVPALVAGAPGAGEPARPLLGFHPGNRGHRPPGPVRLAMRPPERAELGPGRGLEVPGGCPPGVPLADPDVADPRVAELVVPRLCFPVGDLLSAP